MLICRPASTVQLIRNIAIFRGYSTHVSDNVTVSLAPRYNPQNTEAGKYLKWEKLGCFASKPVDGCDKIFSIILPPPNITGTLHLGHALTVTIEDILCRWKRMQGYSVIWVPGTDHAGIATQVMVEKLVYHKTGQTRREIGRKLFFEHLLEWKAIKMNKITDQLKRLGASLDWPRYTFTMDPGQSAAVAEAVIRLFEDGLIYHENSLVNWCPHLQSTISDIEIDHHILENPTLMNVPGYAEPVEFGLIYDFAMKIIGPRSDSGEEIIVSTTRPETIFGDVAVAVHPNDSRYSHLRDTFLHHPLGDCPIPLIFDECVDPNFGTGAVKMTPGHSRKDFEVAKRHDLPVITIFDEFGRLNENCKGFNGENRFAARNQIISQLSALSLLRGVRAHRMRIPVCSRSGDVIEQMIRPQWFLKCDDLAKRAIEAVENGEITIEPQRRVETYKEWLQNMKVWCLSRQLWWGHKLPLYKVGGDWVAARSPHEARVKYAAKHGKMCEEVEQEKDVLDTWFSSALLPFTVFGWPTVDDEFKQFYPLSLMETGVDLLNFWVARMVMLGLYFNDKPPFKKVFLHPMICDNLGRKMSKSLGNIIEPDCIINGISLKELNKVVATSHSTGLISSEERQKALQFQKDTFPDGIQACGADALRLTLAQRMVLDHSIFFNLEECVENVHFCNKLWQASKFTIGWADKFEVGPELPVEPTYLWQKWLLHRLFLAVDRVNVALESTNMSEAVTSLKEFLINDFCDTCLVSPRREISKPVLKSGELPEAKSTASVMLFSLETYLRLLSPVVPYICDEIYAHLPNCSTKIVAECTYPCPDEYRQWANENIGKEMKLVTKVVKSVRSLLQGVRCKNRDSDVVICSKEERTLHAYRDVILSLTRCRSVEIRNPPCSIIGPSFVAGNVATVHIVMEEMNINHVIANFGFLKERITHLCSSINEKIDAYTKDDSSDGSEGSESSSSSDSGQSSDSENESERIRLFDEWKTFETELNIALRYFDTNGIVKDDLMTVMEFLKKIYEYRFQFQSVLAKPRYVSENKA